MAKSACEIIAIVWKVYNVLSLILQRAIRYKAIISDRSNIPCQSHSKTIGGIMWLYYPTRPSSKESWQLKSFLPWKRCFKRRKALFGICVNSFQPHSPISLLLFLPKKTFICMFQYFMHLRYDRPIMLQGYNDTSISEFSLTSTKCRTLWYDLNMISEILI